MRLMKDVANIERERARERGRGSWKGHEGLGGLVVGEGEFPSPVHLSFASFCFGFWVVFYQSKPHLRVCTA